MRLTSSGRRSPPSVPTPSSSRAARLGGRTISREAPIHVSVSRSNGNALVEVEDAGPGMSPEEADRVFERFYRADASRTRASGGVGLGLSIVAAVAEAHGGGATVRSTPGHGSTFSIELPLLRDGFETANGRLN